MSENISEPESSDRLSARVAELEAKLAEADQIAVEWTNRGKDAEAALREAREGALKIVEDSRMTECFIEPLFGAGWNGCIEHLLVKLAALGPQTEPQAAEVAGQATGKCVEVISDGLEDKRRMDILERLREMGELSLGNNNGLFENAKETQAVATIGPDGSRDYCASTVREVLDLVANALWGDALDRAVLAARSPKERAE